jgi:hypothetical protein
MSQLTDNEDVLSVAWLLHHNQRSIMRRSGFKKVLFGDNRRVFGRVLWALFLAAEKGKVGTEVEDQATAFFSRSGPER